MSSITLCHPFVFLWPDLYIHLCGVSMRWAGRCFQEQLIILKEADHILNVTYEGLSLLCCHGFGESPTLQEEE